MIKCMRYDLIAHRRIEFYKSSTLQFLNNNQCVFNIICPLQRLNNKGYEIISWHNVEVIILYIAYDNQIYIFFFKFKIKNKNNNFYNLSH